MKHWITLLAILMAIPTVSATTLEISVNQTNKKATITGDAAVRETVDLEITGIGSENATNWYVMLISGTNMMAIATNLTQTVSTAYGELNLNTVELTNHFANAKIGRADRKFDFVIWNTVSSNLIANDTIELLNNPYTALLATPTAVNDWAESDARYLTLTSWQAAAAYGISVTDTSSWTTAYGWGDHSSVGYATEADLTIAEGRITVLEGSTSNGDTAYTWVAANSNDVAYLLTRTNEWNQAVTDATSWTNFYAGNWVTFTNDWQGSNAIFQAHYDLLSSQKVSVVTFSGSGLVWQAGIDLAQASADSNTVDVAVMGTGKVDVATFNAHTNLTPSTGAHGMDQGLNTTDSPTFASIKTTQVSLDGGATDGVFFDAAGRIGIGTNDPSRLLDMRSTGGFGGGYRLSTDAEFVDHYFVDNSINSDYRISYAGSGNYDIGVQSDGDVILGLGGNVGIGTESPVTDFVVSDSGKTGLEVDAVDASNFVLMRPYDRVEASYKEFQFRSDGVKFRDSSNNDVLTIHSSGRIGIGTASPDTTLDVNGAITVRELSADPADPDEGSFVKWMSDGTGSGDDGDIMMKITAGGVTKTTTLGETDTLATVTARGASTSNTIASTASVPITWGGTNTFQARQGTIGGTNSLYWTVGDTNYHLRLN
jgi:hypothetical protein